jgi:uncharacterized protein
MNNSSSSNFLVFSHEQDVDGLWSAAVLKMTYPQSEVMFTNHGFQNMLAEKYRILSFTKSSNSGSILISDIGINNESHLPVFEALSFSKQKGFSNIWIDHHVWPVELEEIFSPICEMVLYSESGTRSNAPKKCATELCTE